MALNDASLWSRVSPFVPPVCLSYVVWWRGTQLFALRHTAATFVPAAAVGNRFNFDHRHRSERTTSRRQPQPRVAGGEVTADAGDGESPWWHRPLPVPVGTAPTPSVATTSSVQAEGSRAQTDTEMLVARPAPLPQVVRDATNHGDTSASPQLETGPRPRGGDHRPPWKRRAGRYIPAHAWLLHVTLIAQYTLLPLLLGVSAAASLVFLTLSTVDDRSYIVAFLFMAAGSQLTLSYVYSTSMWTVRIASAVTLLATLIVSIVAVRWMPGSSVTGVTPLRGGDPTRQNLWITYAFACVSMLVGAAAMGPSYFIPLTREGAMDSAATNAATRNDDARAARAVGTTAFGLSLATFACGWELTHAMLWSLSIQGAPLRPQGSAMTVWFGYPQLRNGSLLAPPWLTWQLCVPLMLVGPVAAAFHSIWLRIRHPEDIISE